MKGASEEQILFPDVEVEGYTVRPWTLAQVVELASTFSALVSIVEESRISGAFADILDSIDINDPAMESLTSAFKRVWKDVVKSLPGLVPRFIPLAPKIISVSLKIPMEEAGAFDLGKTVKVLRAIGVLNVEYLKNCFGPDTVDQAKAS